MQWLYRILEALPVGIAVLRAIRTPASRMGRITDFGVVQLNSAFRTAFTPRTNAVTELAEPLLSRLFPQLWESGLLSRCITCVEGGHPDEFEIPTGTTSLARWYQASLTPEGDQLTLSLTDITETRRTRLAHHFQAELLQSISDNIPAGLALWEAVYDGTPARTLIDFRYRMSNRINSGGAGYTEDQLIGRALLTLFPRFRGTELETALRETLETGISQRLLFTGYLDQPDRWIEAQFSRMDDGLYAGSVLMTYLDVTDRHRAQLASQQQADLLQTVINVQPAGVALFSPVREPATGNEPERIVDFTYELVNETQLRVTSRSAAGLIGQRLRSLYPGAGGRDLFERMVAVAQDGQPQAWLLPSPGEGSTGWFQASLIRYGEQVLFTFLDASELILQQQALEVANLNLVRSNENLQQFAYVASHDLQEPLRKIRSFGDLLEANYAGQLGEGLDYLKRMQTAAGRMSLLIRDLLTFARIATQPETNTSVSLQQVVQQVLDNLELTISETNAQLTVSSLPTVQGDPSQLTQLFQNLLSNALKFRLPEVAPIISLSSQLVALPDLPALLVVNRPGTTYNCISLTDNGIGFEEKYTDRIFQVFQRLHGKDSYPGTGIGLAICEKVVANHGGAIIVSSQPGRGTTFTIYLPA